MILTVREKRETEQLRLRLDYNDLDNVDNWEGGHKNYDMTAQ